MAYSSFEDFEVWKRAARLAVDVIRALRGCREYSLKDQMARSSISIASNIAEGAERGSDTEFIRFLNIAKASAAELRTQTYIAQAAEAIPQLAAQELVAEQKEISRMLQGLIGHLRGKKE